MRTKDTTLPTFPRPFTRQAAGIATAIVLTSIALCGVAHAQTPKAFLSYLKPSPIVSPLSDASWGEAALPRDLSNGIESAKGAGVHPDYYYWDGQIIKAKDGKYHMFMSTFSGNTNFGTSWQSSDAYHAISETDVLGPYKRQDYVYTNGGSHKGHNVSAAQLSDGSYVVIVSEIVPFQLYKSTSLDGPWTGCSPAPQSDIGGSNISFIERHDGKFEITERNGTIAIADTLCGHYVKQKPTCAYTQNPTDAQGNPVVGSIYAKRTSIPGVSSPAYTWQEDPHIWRSAGTYHVIYSGSGDRVGWHVYSPDGLTWKDNGYAWSPRDYKKIFCYEGSTTCNAWYKMERPGVVLQDGHPTHITWAVSDVDKDNQVTPGTNHGTKVVVVPFDGVAFDNDFGTGGGDAGAGGTGGSSGTGGAGGGSGRDGGVGGSGSGGATGTGGRGGSDGGLGGDGSSGGSGGRSGGTGGTTGGLGGNGSGGASGSGGRLGGSGGTTVVASGGGTSGGGAGGMSASSAGGSGASGTTTGSGGHGAGGLGSGGQAGGQSGSAGASTTPGGSSSSGCSCSLQGRQQASGGGSLLLLAFVLPVLVRRRRSAPRSNDAQACRPDRAHAPDYRTTSAPA